MKKDKIIVIGAGAGGLTAAADLARRGAEVIVLERAAAPGGKMRRVSVGGAGIDAGPTVFTMRWIFEGLFRDCGARLEDYLNLTSADILARHAWRRGGRLDLYADIEKSADAIGAFAGAREADGYRAFCARSADIYRTLVQTFIASEKPSNPLDLVFRVGLSRLDALWRTAPMKSLWSAIGENFSDPRLRQLFGRYATYVGSSPFLAPATLMLVAHVEQDGVWLVRGGMHEVACALQRLGEAQGATYRFNTHVREIVGADGRARGVVLESGERLDADAIVFNGDANAVAAGLLGPSVTKATASTPREARSLSAITWCANAVVSGDFPLVHHNVFFAEDYAREFDAILKERTLTQAPTVYICAQDRSDAAMPQPGVAERLLILINSPPDGDRGEFSDPELARFEQDARDLMSACGLVISDSGARSVRTTPFVFNQLFPATGGALYGLASHGSNATFQRPAAVTRIAGLYFAGGSVHPGAGVPMAAMSGRLAAARVLEDLAAARDGRSSAGAIRIATSAR
ncbi:MAG: 1-hydroxycarotenoid 3,4-desaturase CrtD [Hyphomicrobium sp.]